MTDRAHERLALAAAAVALALASAFAVGRALTGSLLFGPLLAIQIWAGCVALTVAARAALGRRADEEAHDFEAARRESPDTTIFGGPLRPGEEPLSAARSRDLFERWAAPVAAPLFALGLGAAAWSLLRGMDAPQLVAPSPRMSLVASFAVVAFTMLVGSRYLIVRARRPGGESLRAAGVALGASALAAAAALAARLAVEAGSPEIEGVMAWLLGIGVGVLGMEQAVLAVLDAYRPRGADARAPAPPYESRIVRRLCDPSSWTRGAAESLDYQFGFHVSRTWLAAFLGRALLPLLAFQILVVYAMTTVVILGPHEEAVLERFGRPRAESEGGWRLEPGFHWKRPWPFDTVRRAPARRILETHVGYDGSVRNPAEVLWSRPHFEREDMILTAASGVGPAGAADAAVPVNLINVNVPIEYRIADLRAYVYAHRDPAAALRAAAMRALTREAAGRNLFDVLGAGQKVFASHVAARIRTEVDAMGLGLEVVFVGLQGAHPPVAVAESFDRVVGALEERESAIFAGRAHAARVTPMAAAEAEAIRLGAQARRAEQELGAQAEADQFLARRSAHDRSPRVYRGRALLEAVRNALRTPRLYVVAAQADAEVVHINLEEKLPAGLFDFGAPSGAPPSSGNAAGMEARP